MVISRQDTTCTVGSNPLAILSGVMVLYHLLGLLPPIAIKTRLALNTLWILLGFLDPSGSFRPLRTHLKVFLYLSLIAFVAFPGP